MSQIVPFKALRPWRELAKQVAACPYDVVSLEEAREIVHNKHLSFLRVEKSEVDVPTYPEGNVYGMARMNLHDLLEKGILFQERKECLYIYRQQMGSHVQTGIVAGASVEEYESGKIKRHELTRTDKETDRIKHITMVNAQTGPVFLTYKSRLALDRIVERIASATTPEYDFVADDGVAHTVWIVSEENDIRAVQAEFAKVDTLYIADGHHRAAAAAAVAKTRRTRAPKCQGDEPYNHIMAVIFPHDQLRIMDYNRAVRDLNGLDVAGFLQKATGRFRVEEHFAEKSPRRPHEFGMYLDGRWFKLSVRESATCGNDPLKSLDVSILQDHLLEPVLGIRDPRTDRRIEFIGGVRGMGELERLVDSGGFAVAFSLYPTSLDQLMTVADQGRVMPPKSTWFEPKLLSGLFVYPLE